jgi:UDP-N-acetylglucosamine 4,6-dehydratase
MKVLVTGGTGSFGNAIIDCPEMEKNTMIVYSRDESKQHDMYLQRKERDIEYIIGDVRDKDSLIRAMKGVDYVFHAAALKHVTTGEKYPSEVIATNIMGTKNVIEAAEYCGVLELVVLSTDKAAYPINAYGMSKAIAEKLAVAHSGDLTTVCLRYGNVLGSRNSVIPVFVSMINKKVPITITNYDMTRFILTLEEAVALALHCWRHGRNGDLFVMRPPACTIRTLVRALELKYGAFEQQVIGIRPGEKMHETLLTSDEVARSTVETVNGIEYSKISLGVYDDYHTEGIRDSEPQDYSSLNAEHLTAEQVLDKLMGARLLW